MSYDLELLHPVTKQPMVLKERHHMTGGTYQVGGCPSASLNVTYNYAPFFYEVLDKEVGIRLLYGLTGSQSAPILDDATHKLKGPASRNYWDACAGNARNALSQLHALALLCPDGIWAGD